MQNEIKIRKALTSDVKAINEIINTAIRESSSNWAWSQRSYEDAMKWFNEHDCDKYCVFVAEKDGIVTGFSSLSPLRLKEGYWPIAENSVYIDKKYRGQGYGGVLLKALIDRAKACDLWAISAWIDSENRESILLHGKFGFYITGELKNIGEKFGEKRSVTIMQLDI